jgi:hypothetical protein
MTDPERVKAERRRRRRRRRSRRVLQEPCRAGSHTHDVRWVPELQRACTAGQCSLCGTWFPLDYADEPMVDMCAAMIIQDREAGEQPRTTHSEASGLAGTLLWYGTPGWDAGWVASAHEHHDAIMRDVVRCDECPGTCAPGDCAHDAAAMNAIVSRMQAAAAAARLLEEYSEDVQPTVTIDSDGNGPAVQINHLDSQGVSPLFDPAETERLADDLMLGADAARQAAQDGYEGPAVVVALAVGAEPVGGVEGSTLSKNGGEYAPGGEVCIADAVGEVCIADAVDDVRECECRQCDWERVRRRLLELAGDPDPEDWSLMTATDDVPTPHPDTLAAPPRSWPPNTGTPDSAGGCLPLQQGACVDE